MTFITKTLFFPLCSFNSQLCNCQCTVQLYFPFYLFFQLHFLPWINVSAQSHCRVLDFTNRLCRGLVTFLKSKNNHLQIANCKWSIANSCKFNILGFVAALCDEVVATEGVWHFCPLHLPRVTVPQTQGWLVSAGSLPCFVTSLESLS